MIGLAGTALANLLPANFSGGFGLAGLLAVAFPYLQKALLHLFDFNLTEYFSDFFAPGTFLGKLFDGSSALGTGVGVVSIGAFIALLQQIWSSLQTLYTDYFSMSLEIPSSDSSYWQILEWVHERQMKNPKHLSLQTVMRQATTGKWENVHDFIPSVGTHKFKFQGKKFQIDRKRSSQPSEANDFAGLENVVLSASGSNTLIFRDMLAAVKKFKEIKNEGKTMVYTASQSCWQPSGSGKRKRPMDSVILDVGVAETILADVRDFIDSAAWYTEFGVPYRRGYLLHGPPGTGKTSFISAVAGMFDLNICILNLSDKSLSDDGLNRLLIDAPENSLILLEDVDAAFGNREETGKKDEDKVDGISDGLTTATAFEGMNRLTFSGLLNALDGVASAEGRILFMTTNYVDKLDPALIRPGRVDTRHYIGYASESQVERMFRRFYRDATDEDADRFVREVFNRSETKEISLAQMQDMFVRFKSNPAQIFTGLSMPDQWTPRVKSLATSRSGRGGGRGRGRGRGKGGY